MKVGLVGYLGGGKSTLFELLTGDEPDPAKVQTGQVGTATVPDERFDRLVEIYRPKKVVPAKIELFDTPGLSRSHQSANAQRLGVIRGAAALVHVIGVFAGADPLADVSAFTDDLVLADLQVVTGRIERLREDAAKPRPDREELQAELEALGPIAAHLEDGRPVSELALTERQEEAVRSFALLTRKRRLEVLNTAEAGEAADLVQRITAQGRDAMAIPAGLELELQALPEEERREFAAEMGITEPSRDRLLRKVFEVTDQITFYTCAEKEVHAWLLKRGSTVLEAADTVHSDLARGFVRAEVFPTDDLVRLGSERELKAAGLQHVEGKEYVVRDGDEIFIRSGV